MDSTVNRIDQAGMVVMVPDLARITDISDKLKDRDTVGWTDTAEKSEKQEVVHKVHSGEHIGYRSVKRSMDIFCSVVGLVCLSWLFLIIAILIKAEDGGPVFYKQKRLGKDGKEFLCYKFRTMFVDADDLERWLSPEQLEEYYKNCKLQHDPRITRVGRFLRKTSLDELPQLINTLNDTMSLVGPRPCVKREAESYGEYEDLLLSVKPGITGYWQVHGRSEVGFITDRAKELQLYYVTHRSIWLDVKILFRTVGVVVGGKGAV